jgi:hypothetical protein
LEIAILSAAKNPGFTNKGSAFGVLPGGVCPRKEFTVCIDWVKPVFTKREKTIDRRIDFNPVPDRRLVLHMISEGFSF